MKDHRLNIRITQEQKKLFDKWCIDNGSTISDQIRRYITTLTKTLK